MVPNITMMGKIQSGSLNVYQRNDWFICCRGENQVFDSFPIKGFLKFSKIRNRQYASNTNAIGCHVVNKLILNFENLLCFI